MAWISLAPTIEKEGEIHLSLAFLSNGEKVIHNGYEKWPIEVEKCTHQRIGNKRGVSCGVCIAVCPWNKPYTPFHRFVQETMRDFPFARRFGVCGDEPASCLFEPKSMTLLSYIRLMINGQDIAFLKGLETALHEGDEILILPPVSGG